jgi:hypothetical protein
MSKNQSHGIQIEKLIKNEFELMPGKVSYFSKSNQDWDLDSNFDDELNLPTSIKTSKLESDIIYLSDARRFFSLTESFRLLLCPYIQADENKVFQKLYEYIINIDILNRLYGELSYTDIEVFHNLIQISNIKDATVAHVFSKKYKQENISNKKSYITINPKIDSKDQRRVQCSIKISTLNKFITPNIYEKYKNLIFPITILSSERERSR